MVSILKKPLTWTDVQKASEIAEPKVFKHEYGGNKIV